MPRIILAIDPYKNTIRTLRTKNLLLILPRSKSILQDIKIGLQFLIRSECWELGVLLK